MKVVILASLVNEVVVPAKPPDQLKHVRYISSVSFVFCTCATSGGSIGINLGGSSEVIQSVLNMSPTPIFFNVENGKCLFWKLL